MDDITSARALNRCLILKKDGVPWACVAHGSFYTVQDILIGRKPENRSEVFESFKSLIFKTVTHPKF